MTSPKKREGGGVAREGEREKRGRVQRFVGTNQRRAELTGWWSLFRVECRDLSPEEQSRKRPSGVTVVAGYSVYVSPPPPPPVYEAPDGRLNTNPEQQQEAAVWRHKADIFLTFLFSPVREGEEEEEAKMKYKVSEAASAAQIVDFPLCDMSNHCVLEGIVCVVTCLNPVNFSCSCKLLRVWSHPGGQNKEPALIIRAGEQTGGCCHGPCGFPDLLSPRLIC